MRTLLVLICSTLPFFQVEAIEERVACRRFLFCFCSVCPCHVSTAAGPLGVTDWGRAVLPVTPVTLLVLIPVSLSQCYRTASTAVQDGKLQMQEVNADWEITKTT